MGCVCSTRTDPYTGLQHTDSLPNLNSVAAAAVCFPVPFGHVSYTPALPGILGPLTDLPTGWWYYAGWAADKLGNTQFTIHTQIIRVGKDPIDPAVTTASILYGIGIKTPDSDCFVTQLIPGIGDFPSPTSSSWSISCSVPTTEVINSQMMSCKLVAGTLGLSGATYQLDMADPNQGVALSLSLKDTLGMIMEGAAGTFPTKIEEDSSYEVAMPSLSIQQGSTISIDEKTTILSSGSIWLDRQTLTKKLDPNQMQLRPLYTGNWLAVNMNDGTVYNFSFFWKPQRNQWIVGSELDPPVPPVNKIGIEYPALKTWNGSSPVQGAHILESTEFDLNILKPKDPQESPHWKSNTSGNTYCTAWQLRIRGKDYTMSVLLPDSEVKAGMFFFEGAATLYVPFRTHDKIYEVEVGHAFVEQMGYN